MRRVTLVLPLDDIDSSPGPTTTLAPGLGSLGGASLGIVDNGLWRAMRIFGEVWRDVVHDGGAAGVETVPFDHLAIDFADQQRALRPFAQRVRGAVTGLGN